MNLDFVLVPKWLQRCYPKRLWHQSREEKTMYLTFDDGPIPEVTPWVLDQLKRYNAKATFFCIGENIKKHPELFKRILLEGHAVGNHTQHHVNGWRTPIKTYIKEVALCEKQIGDLETGIAHLKTTTNKAHISENKTFSKLIGPKLFRPPYGKLTSKKAKALMQQGYHIVMWDVLSMDYSTNTSKEVCLTNVVQNAQPGSIVVFHDSLKAKKNLQYVLPKVLEGVRLS